MKEFNLEGMKAGEPVVTRCGKPWKYIGTCSSSIRPLVGEIGLNVDFWRKNGRYGTDEPKGFETPEPHPYDLFMAPVKKQEWCNIYLRGHASNGYSIGVDVYPSEADAKTFGTTLKGFVTTVLIREWEE